MDEPKKSFAERFFKFTASLQDPHARLKKTPTIYGDITNRMFAGMLDLCILLVPLYFLTNLGLAIFGQEQLFITIEKIRRTVPPETFSRLQLDFFAMLGYISERYPHDAETIIRQIIFIRAFQFAMIGLYVIPFTYKIGATPGKIIVGLKIVDVITKDKLSLSQSIIRYLSYITFPIGMMTASLRRDRRALHDFLADTQVIYSPNRWYKIRFDSLKLRLRKYFNMTR